MTPDNPDENAQLRARIEELTNRVIAAETNNVDAADLQRENNELRRLLADAPTTEAAVARLRQWVPDYEAGAAFVAMPVAMARKLLAAIDGESACGFKARNPAGQKLAHCVSPAEVTVIVAATPPNGRFYGVGVETRVCAEHGKTLVDVYGAVLVSAEGKD